MREQLDERHCQIHRLEQMLSADLPESKPPMTREERQEVGQQMGQLVEMLQGKIDWPKPKPEPHPNDHQAGREPGNDQIE